MLPSRSAPLLAAPLLAALLLLLCLLIVPAACGPKQPAADASSASPSASSASTQAALVAERAVQSLPLGPPLDEADMEISGLTWHRDTLVVLPQYPSRHAPEGSFRLYGIPRTALQAALASEAPEPLTPVPLPLQTLGIGADVPEYEGCEALAFANGRMYVLLEARRDGAMRGFLLTGRAPSLRALTVDAGDPRRIPVQADLPNMAYEALAVWRDTVLTFYEANGARVNARPVVRRFTPDAEPLDTVRFPTLEYRLTDATSVDDAGRFWVTNYFYPGERDVLRPAPDSLRMRHGVGRTHSTSDVVERLVEYRYTGRRVVRTSTPPLWLTLGGGTGRNWEGVVRFGDGFLIATDRYPRSMLAYVARPAS